MTRLIADIVVGVQHGDEGKGKVTHALLEGGDYTHCIRYNGGGNAGHTIYHEGRKFVTHHVPAGVFFGIKSIIGPGCVLNIEKFFEELTMLREGGIDVENKIFIAKNVHIIQENHVEEDSKDTSIGTTRTGNGPCYRDKYSRTGKRAQDHSILSAYLIDMYAELHFNNKDVVALFEGAQGFSLDVDWGDYPYVTSSHCTTAGALLNGLSHKNIRHVYGVAKAYETYVGTKNFQPPLPVFNKLQEVGEEFGATTGRKRQCNWMNLATLKKACDINGVDRLVINKMDILQKVDEWKLQVGATENSAFFVFQSQKEFCEYIEQYLENIEIKFSYSPMSV